MKYQSELINEILEDRGHKKSSLHYESECVKSWIEENKGAYPKLCEYEGEWLNYIVENPIGNFPYETITANPTATVSNVVPYEYKSAILKGNTLVNLIQTIDKTILEQYQDVVNLIHVKPSTKYLLKIKNNTSEAKSFYSSEITEWTQIDIEANQTITKTLTTKSTLGRNTLLQNLKTHTTEHDLSIIFIEYQDGMENWDIPYFEGMQSAKMPVLTTTNEDGTKSNILTVNEDVELRGIGNVKDELNLLTGELTQKIGEIVLDGNMISGLYTGGQDGFISAFLEIPNIKNQPQYEEIGQTYIITNKFISTIFGWDMGFENISLHPSITDRMYLTLKLDTIGITTDMEHEEKLRLFGKYLLENTHTVQYQLATESVKTVELTVTNQDGETLSKIKPIEGTMNIESSGATINPTAVLEIPVEAITQNLNSFIEEE